MTTVCVDCGHGYDKVTGRGDKGAVNGQYYEADATLILGKKVTNRLRNNGYKVVMTRNTDKPLTLQQRCDISNDYGCELFLSIHTNSASNKSANGIETFHAPVCQTRSKVLAKNVQSSLIKLTGARDRGVKQEAFYVLKNTKASAILIEVGFISNPDEVKKIFTTDYQNKLADAIVKGVMETVKA